MKNQYRDSLPFTRSVKGHGAVSKPLYIVGAALLAAHVALGADMGTAFTYQGFLEKGSPPAPVTDTCDFRFGLWDAAAGGNQKGSSPQTVLAVPAPGGVFTATVDFDVDAIDGTARWLAIEVQCPGDPVFVLLNPRVELTPAPHALALPGLYTQQNGFSPNLIGGYSGNTVTAGAVGGTIGGGGDVTRPNQVTDSFGTVGGGVGNVASALAATIGGGGSRAMGFFVCNDGTSLGMPCTFCVGQGVPPGIPCSFDYECFGGRCEPDNSVCAPPGICSDESPGNRVSGDYGTIGGGSRNTASNDSSTVGGGDYNTASGLSSTVGGGSGNNATVDSSTVSGGYGNTASGQLSTVGGGVINAASGAFATVPGGYSNEAGGDMSFAAGRQAKVRTAAQVGSGTTGDQGTFVWGDSTGPDFTSSGPNQFLIRAAGGVGINKNTPATGALDVAGNILASGTIKSGSSITITGTAGSENIASSASLDLRTAAGRALRLEDNAISPNLIGGYSGNTVTPGMWGATIGGGGFSGNPNTAGGKHATVGGGAYNTASEYMSTVGGGHTNRAIGTYSTVGGGNTNIASGQESTVGGGLSNTASGHWSTVPGGYFNEAGGDVSFAAGRQAKVRRNDQGTFVWADNMPADFISSGTNQFLVRASGGMWFGITSAPSIPAGRFINTSTGGYLSTGGTWTDLSDREAKENFEPLDARVVLERLTGMPITRWNFKVQRASARHIGPTAQDFHAAFGTGEDEKHLAPLDTAGVALAAIQGLYEIVQEKNCEVEELGSEISNLKSEISELKEIVNALSKQNGGGQ